MELALCLPFVCLIALGVVQVAVIASDQVAVVAAAREGARAAAVSASPGQAATSAASHRAGMEPVTVRAETTAGLVTVTVRYTDHTDVPLIGVLLPDIVVSGVVTMALEPP